MKNINKKLLLAVVVFVLLVLGVGGYFYISSRNATSQSDQAPQGIPEEVIPTLAPSKIGLEMVARSDNRGVKLVLNNATSVSKIEFDLVYDADQASSFGVDEGGSGK